MVRLFVIIFVFSNCSFAAEMSLVTYEEYSLIVRNKTYLGGKDESSLKLLPAVVEPTRKIQGSVEDDESVMSNE